MKYFVLSTSVSFAIQVRIEVPSMLLPRVLIEWGGDILLSLRVFVTLPYLAPPSFERSTKLLFPIGDKLDSITRRRGTTAYSKPFQTVPNQIRIFKLLRWFPWNTIKFS